MPELLFEIGVEELPALAIEPAMAFMQTFLTEQFDLLRLKHSDVVVYGTPRRLLVLVDELSEKQPDSEQEILGPSVQIAFSDDGALSKAGRGFLASKGLDESSIYRKKTDKNEVIAAKKIELGQKTSALLPELLFTLMQKIPFKKRMRWDRSGESFARPISWLVCLFNGEHVPVQFANVTSGTTSRGHRFMRPEPFLVTSNAQLVRELTDRFVVLSPAEREAMFVRAAQEKLAPLHATFHPDPDLLEMVRNLVEYPFVILGKFEDRYLEIPSEILQCEMKAHQKCFSVHDQTGAMMPYFLCSAATYPFDEAVFAKGNARVLRARFEDGAFYFAEDQKKPLREHAKGLSALVFERELGTVQDKSIRIERVACALGELLSVSGATLEQIKHAAPLIKADLVTGVVGQFPELQGVMGRIYAGLDGEPREICDAIEMHYWPRFAHDQVPEEMLSTLLSIADKLDTVVGIIAIGKRPQGNKDPFALRRASIAIIRMVLKSGLSIDLETMIAISINSYGDRFSKNASTISAECKEFMVQRARGLLIEDLGEGKKDYALIADSILAAGSSDLLDAFARAHTLCSMRNQNKEDFAALAQAFKRASNIVKKAKEAGEFLEITESVKQRLILPEEQALLHAIEQTKQHTSASLDKRAGFNALCSAYVTMFTRVAQIKPKLDAFFDNVMVMTDDKTIRHARLSLLSELKAVADRVADFTHL